MKNITPPDLLCKPESSHFNLGMESPPVGAQIPCACCGKVFTIAPKGNGGIDIAIGKITARAALCQKCYRKTWRSLRGAQAVADRIRSRQSEIFTALSVMNEVKSALLEEVKR